MTTTARPSFSAAALLATSLPNPCVSPATAAERFEARVVALRYHLEALIPGDEDLVDSKPRDLHDQLAALSSEARALCRDYAEVPCAGDRDIRQEWLDVARDLIAGVKPDTKPRVVWSALGEAVEVLRKFLRMTEAA